MTQNPLQPTLGELVANLTQQMTSLVKDEVALLKAQVTEKGQKFGIAAGLLAAAAPLALFALALIITTIVLALALVLPAWLAALIVAVAPLLLAGVLAFVAKKQIDAAGEVKPAIADNLKQDVALVKEGFTSEHS